MVIAIIGENCVGKSTLANKINARLNGKIYVGKDYLRLEKNPQTAAVTFQKMLKEAVFGAPIIYVITEKEHLALLPEGAVKFVLTADIQTIKERFKERMKGHLPAPVEKMLESKHGMYDALECHLKLTQNYDVEEVLAQIQ